MLLLESLSTGAALFFFRERKETKDLLEMLVKMVRRVTMALPELLATQVYQVQRDGRWSHRKPLESYLEFLDLWELLDSLERKGRLENPDLLLTEELLESPGRPGSQGPPGPPGLGGLPGQPGISGVKGSSGRDGLVGILGTDGRPGLPGLPGRMGPGGSTGEKGERGDPGSDGNIGESGAQGYPGSRGQTGTAGADGTPGSAGTNGQAGDLGIQGEKYTVPAYSFDYQLLAGDVGERGGPGIDGVPGVVGQAENLATKELMDHVAQMVIQAGMAISEIKESRALIRDQLVRERRRRRWQRWGQRLVFFQSDNGGDFGYTGEAGKLGASGAEGEVGDNGRNGTEGPPGPKIDEIAASALSIDNCPLVEKDLPAAPGGQGGAGPEGRTGPQGNPGTQGERGRSGDDGEVGDPGPPGPEGPQTDYTDIFNSNCIPKLPVYEAINLLYIFISIVGPPGQNLFEALSNIGSGDKGPLQEGFRLYSSKRSFAQASENQAKTQLFTKIEFDYLTKLVDSKLSNFRVQNGNKEHPARSCRDIQMDHPDFQSGLYCFLLSRNASTRVYR
ncbi:hypothetical protein OS493_033778 [Desmophyllum pertusum]|uniref:Fibrillar collagen NC1 domain-containing protein n=1 Tax=Desmophyllum pertusum TaxID=174260 RepID=A0A9X0CQ71_9CNID|nr:hypothetical protein OS493_033778 [Desmophyllum pertusum]